MTTKANTAIKILLFVGMPMIIFIFGIVETFHPKSKFSWAIFLLFSIPVFIHFIGWYRIEKETANLTNHTNEAESFCFFYNATMFISIMSYAIGWLLYIYHSIFLKEHLAIFSKLCVVLIFFQILIAAVVTYVILEDLHKHKISYLNELKIGLTLFPFWRFAHFFAIFMSTTFLFGFAFAFHDLEVRKNKNFNEMKPALYVENIDSDDEEEKNISEKQASSNNSDTNQSSNNQTEKNKPICFYFESGRATFIANYRNDEYKEFSLTDEKRRYYNRESKNYQEMKKLISVVKDHKSKGIPRITLIGRADDKKSGDIYRSNYELSEARVRVIKSAVTNAFYLDNEKIWQNFDWLEVPLSNEIISNSKDITESSNEIESNCESLKTDNDSERRVVEVLINSVIYDNESRQLKTLREKQEFDLTNRYRTPKLMDYIYFPISKGYGDIKPATSYAKLLDSLENFFEIFFLVCFLGTLISYKRE